MEQRDDKLWALAKKRADFKKQLFSYIVINPFLWAIWWITLGRYTGINITTWPFYATLGWGVALCFKYFDAYGSDSGDMVEKEYNKLKNQNQSN